MSTKIRYSLLCLNCLQVVRQPDNIALVTAKECHEIIERIHARDADGAEQTCVTAGTGCSRKSGRIADAINGKRLGKVRRD